MPTFSSPYDKSALKPVFQYASLRVGREEHKRAKWRGL